MKLDYDIGDTVVLVMDFADTDGPADPSEFTVTVRAPDGTETIYPHTDATNDPAVTGRFTLFVPATQVGRWKAIIAATAGVVAAEPHEWGVRKPPFT